MQITFDALLKQYQPMLSRVASSYEANPSLQQELLQEICLAVWQAMQNFRQQSSVKTFILRVAHNKAISHVAHHARLPNNQSYCEVTDPSAGTTTLPEHALEQQAKIEKLLNAVRNLPLQSRQVITMSMEGLSYKDIANVCGLNESHVGVIINRTRNSLEEYINS